MALTLPTAPELYDFWGDESDPEDIPAAQRAIQQAAALLALATGLTDDPTDANVAFLVKWAICDMAIFLLIDKDNKDAKYSPFQSERIGSYNYSRSYATVSKTVLANEPTGVLLFDRVVAEILDALAYGDGMIVGGKLVFREDYVPLAYEATGIQQFFRFNDVNDTSGNPAIGPNWVDSADNDAGDWY